MNSKANATDIDLFPPEHTAVVLVVDDEEHIFDIIKEYFLYDNIELLYANNPIVARDIINSRKIDLLITDIVMPEETGLYLLHWCKENNVKIPFIVMTGYADTDSVVEALNLGAHSFIKKPFKLEAIGEMVHSALAKKRYDIMQKQFNDHLTKTNNDLRQRVTDAVIAQEQLFFGCLSAFAQTIDARDKYTRQHSANVARLAKKLSAYMGLDGESQHAVETAGSLHDMGKIAVPETILLKPDKLNREEFLVMMKHPVTAHSILSLVPGLENSIPAIKAHHERWDGKGYPEGLAGDDIPLLARILSVCDTWDAMRSDRPYRAALTVDFARKEIVAVSGTQLCPEIVDNFLLMVEERGE